MKPEQVIWGNYWLYSSIVKLVTIQWMNGKAKKTTP